MGAQEKHSSGPVIGLVTGFCRGEEWKDFKSAPISRDHSLATWSMEPTFSAPLVLKGSHVASGKG